jgi:hypothetical protein
MKAKVQGRGKRLPTVYRLLLLSVFCKTVAEQAATSLQKKTRGLQNPSSSKLSSREISNSSVSEIEVGQRSALRAPSASEMRSELMEL